jgi:HK97 family phage major capsid protein
MKEKLEKLLNIKKEQRDNLNKALIESDSKEERAAIGETLSKLAEEIRDVEAMLEEVDEPAAEPDAAGTEPNGNNRSFVAGMTMPNGAQKQDKRKNDPFDTEEYRTAFMEFVCRGKAIPAELRADAVTTTGDAAAVIPTTILKEIIKEVKSYGNLYAAVRKLNVQGGVQIPVLSLMPTASWIGETTDSDTQKLQANTSISFSYFGLECKIAQTLLASVTTLDMFQQLFVPLAVEAMAKALDVAIMNGSGSGQPTGITKDSRVPSANVITLPAADFASWEGWKKKVFAKMKKSYRNGAFYMAQSTFDGYIDGMVDKNGQPIGRVNYGIDGGETYRFGGKHVETVEEDVIKDYESAATGDVVAVFVDLKNYGLNSNMEMQVHKWIDRDTNTVKNQVIMICDGKLIDPNGVLIIKKGAASA